MGMGMQSPLVETIEEWRGEVFSDGGEERIPKRKQRENSQVFQAAQPLSPNSSTSKSHHRTRYKPGEPQHRVIFGIRPFHLTLLLLLRTRRESNTVEQSCDAVTRVLSSNHRIHSCTLKHSNTLIVMVDPNNSMFQNAQHFNINDGKFVIGHYTENIYVTSNASTLDQIPPLPPLRPPSTLFTGRDTYLQALKDHLSPKLGSERKRFLLYGMGGIGKTQICLKFIEQYGKKWFSDIFWIDGSSEHTIDLCLRQITQKHSTDSTPSAESALEWISDRDDWLLVFDNADSGYQV
ncbi:hypothetical protein M378DRAFT_578554, partial [Amanita muscaria Koide BX008]